MLVPDLAGRRAVLLANANSRRGGEWFERAREALERSGIEVVSARLIRSPRVMDAAIRNAVREAVPLVVVGGGDGTINRAAHWLAGSESVLGVLPMGTGNAFARDLGIRTSIDHACEVLSEGEVAAIDLGVIGGRPFVNVATIGLSTLVAGRLSPLRKRAWGPIAYLGPLLQGIRLVRPFHVELTLSEGSASFQSLQVVIGNGRFHAGPFRLPSEAGLDTGGLVVYAVASAERRVLLRYALHLLRGTLDDMSEVLVFRTTSGLVETDPPRRITTDGELDGYPPADFRVLPGALRVIAPPVQSAAQTPPPDRLPDSLDERARRSG